MSEAPNVTGSKIGVGETVWYQTNINREKSVVDELSDRAALCFFKLRTHYIWRGGNLAYDPAGICTKMGYKTVRSFNPGFDELVAAGVVSIEDGMIRFPYADEIIAEVQAGRDRKAKAGALGGDGRTSAYAASKGSSKEPPAEHNRNSAGVQPETECPDKQNQWVSESKKTTTNQQPESKNPPPSPSSGNGSVPGGGGGSKIRQIIAGFDDLLAEYFGEGARRRYPVGKDADTAAEWLSLAGGSLEIVMGSIEEVMKRDTGKPPGSLARYCNSVPNEIDEYKKPSTLTAADMNGSRGRSAPARTSSSPPGDETYLRVFKAASDIGRKDITSRISDLIKARDLDGANDFARSVEAVAAGKKERAAA